MNARVEVPAQGEPAQGEAALPHPVLPPKKRKRRLGRIALMVVVPLLLAIGGAYFWFTGGRYIETDNAYVQQSMVLISADVAGRITDVMVKENERIEAGDVLFKIDAAPYKIALDQAKAELAQARLGVEQLRAAYRTAEAKLKAAQSTADVRHRELDRSKELAGKGYATPATLDESRLAAQQADDEVAFAKQGVDAAAAALDGDPDLPTDQHPTVLSALAKKEQAELDLARTTVEAPAAGIVSQVDKLNVGQYVGEGTPILTLVETDDTWMQANYKETQLTHVVPGQAASVDIDTYPDLALTCSVTSIGAATGSEFSLIPAQNATGNWVKVVQRIPVRIRCEGDGGKVLRTGMSAEVTIDTGKTRLEREF